MPSGLVVPMSLSGTWQMGYVGDCVSECMRGHGSTQQLKVLGEIGSTLLCLRHEQMERNLVLREKNRSSEAVSTLCFGCQISDSWRLRARLSVGFHLEFQAQKVRKCSFLHICLHIFYIWIF